jgi:hypothetical protein
MHGIAFEEPVGNSDGACESKSLFAKEIIKALCKSMPEIIVLLHMAELMNGQVLVPWQVAKFKDVGGRDEIKFTFKWCQGHIAVRQRGVAVHEDVDLAKAVAKGKTCIGSGFMYKGGDAVGLFLGSLGKDDAHRIGIDLFPFQRRRKGAELLCMGSNGCDEKEHKAKGWFHGKKIRIVWEGRGKLQANG